MSRLENTAKNFVWSTVSTLLSALIGFVSRMVFINVLGTAYLGVNGLFTNLLTMLSFTELGIGAAINFSLYKPLASNDIEQIKTLMNFYKKAYRVIAGIITVLGLILLPFIKLFIKGGEGIQSIYLIYMIFLFNTAYSYLFTYKRTLLFADQKSYLITNIQMVINILTLLIQLAILLVFKNYIAYLISMVIIGVLQNFYVNGYINKRYPYLLEKKVQNLSKENRTSIVKNVKALLIHKLGDLCISQTDNIIISSFINITVVGLVSNYFLLINTVNSFLMNLFNAANASWGHLIATETEEKRLSIFNGYNFLAFCFFGWASICFYNLLNPFVTLWIGKDKLIGQVVINLLIINFYVTGMRIPLANIKAAAGVYFQDRFVSVIQAAINLIVSIIGVRYLGLAGVFIGSVVSSLAVPCWYRPIVVYKYVLAASPKTYFSKYICYALLTGVNTGITYGLSTLLFKNSITWVSVFGTGMICTVIPFIVISLCFRNTKEYQYVKGLVKTLAYGRLLKRSD